MTTLPNYGLNAEVVDAYRRTLIFNNDLLINEFPTRYDFKVSEHVRRMRAAGDSEAAVAKYQQRAAELKQKRWDSYRAKLTASVEPSVKRYAEGIRLMLLLGL